MNNITRAAAPARLDTHYRILLCITRGLVEGLSDNDIVARLNAENLTSETGLPFNSNRLRQLLKSLRNPLSYPSTAYKALLRLHAERRLSSAQCRPLLAVRGGPL